MRGFGFDDLDLVALHRRHSIKWRSHPADVLPAWVAEMDVAPAPPVAAAITEALERGDLGYAVDLRAPELSEAFAGFADRRWGWQVDPERVVLLKDVMRGIELWISGFTVPGEGVVITTPVYYPFLEAITSSGRTLITVPTERGERGWTIDLEAMEQAFRAGHRLLLLCNPHNPVGRAYREHELRAVAELVDRFDVRVVSDEIHAPLVYPPAQHIPFATLDDEIARRTLTLHSASKAFNLAGLHAAVALPGCVADEEYLTGLAYRQRGAAGILGIAAATAAYAAGDTWLNALLVHLEAVRDHLADRLATCLPAISWIPPEATYLAWLDCSALGLSPTPAQAFLDRGRVALNEGGPFGPGAEQFVRLNFGTSRAIVSEVVDRMATTVMHSP